MPRTNLRRYFRHGLFPQLMVFEAAARLGGVTRAAEELHLAQPTVSMQLKKLSETLELALFEQRGRHLHLTSAGEALRELCDELIELFSRAEARLAGLRGPKAETLRLAAEPEARQVAARLLAAFCSRHPGIHATLHIADRAELLARIAVGVDDVYLFELEVDGLPLERRWSVAHAKGRELARSAAAFVREALLLDAYNSEPAVGDK
ncbi:MAG TPA: LysR family transcriptional regulator [Burkholderiales bacterium]|nr:LysR family transcriptional regulator [Burkholderiales bacterium]